MSDILCAAWSCWHERTCDGAAPDDNPDEFCPGCRTPRLAADGLLLCTWHTRRLADNAIQAGQLWADLDRLAGGTPAGEKVASSAEPGLTVNEAAITARDIIKGTLVRLAMVIHEERGWSLPADRAAALATFIGRNSMWLAGHPAACEHDRDLEDVARDPLAWRLAYPARGDRRYIGTCPVVVRDGPCGARLHWRRDENTVTCGGCGTSAPVDWWRDTMVGDTPAIVDAYAAARELSRLWNRPVEPRIVRQWSWRATGGLSVLREPPPDPADPEKPGRVIRDRLGRTLLDLAEVVATATKQWGPPVERMSA
jgi:hypothetical protein